MKLFKTSLLLSFVSVGLLFISPVVQSETQVYGSQLMTQQERIEHRNTLRNLKTQTEREQYRIQHHKKMQERAKARGVNLPDVSQSGKGKQNKDGSGFGGGGRGR